MRGAFILLGSRPRRRVECDNAEELSSASPGPEGEGSFAVGKRRATLGPGAVTWSTPGEPHGVANDSDGNLVLLVAVARNPNR